MIEQIEEDSDPMAQQQVMFYKIRELIEAVNKLEKVVGSSTDVGMMLSNLFPSMPDDKALQSDN
jgi:hypothetical protein